MSVLRGPAGVMFALSAVLGGCGGQQFGSELTVRPKPLRLKGEGSYTIRLPADEKFSVAVPRAKKQPGLDGSADADARAQGSGAAEAFAKVRRNGVAEATFQLGHTFANESDDQIDLQVRAKCRYEFDVSNEPQTPLPDAVVELRLYARSVGGRLVRDLPLVDFNAESGPACGQADASWAFTVTLTPGEVMAIFAAGRAYVDSAKERSGQALLRVSDLSFEVITRPARAARAAGPTGPPAATKPQEPSPQ